MRRLLNSSSPCQASAMCNLYSLSKHQTGIIQMVRAMSPHVGNLPPMPGIFPDYAAPVIRANEAGERELAMLRWGMPSSKKALLDAATMSIGVQKGPPIGVQ